MLPEELLLVGAKAAAGCGAALGRFALLLSLEERTQLRQQPAQEAEFRVEPFFGVRK